LIGRCDGKALATHFSALAIRYDDDLVIGEGLLQGPQRHRALLLPAQGFQAYCHAIQQTRPKLLSSVCLVAAVVYWM
jgi:hypothetical protein